MPKSEYRELHRVEIIEKVFSNLEKRNDLVIGQFRKEFLRKLFLNEG